MLTTAAIITILFGLAMSLVLQAWVQPRQFREDNKRQADLITSRFDAQLDAVRQLSANAAKTLEEAAIFFKSSERRFQELEQRLGILENAWETTHRLVEQVACLDKRMACLESTCKATHERSIAHYVNPFDEGKHR